MQCCKSVKIRQNFVKTGWYSLFLEFYPGYRNPDTMELIRRKSLDIYIYTNPKNALEVDFNRRMMEKAEAIRCRVYEQVVNERYDFFQPDKMKESFLDYLLEQCKNDKSKRLSAYKHFSEFVYGHCTFGEVDVQLCNKFREYLLGERKLKNGQKIQIGKNTASAYFNVFRYTLKRAFSAEKIRENIAERLKPIPWTNPVREHLTLEELRRVYNTPCATPVLKKAILFSCMTGLRLSDILNLRWEDFRSYSDGGIYLEFLCAKTDRQTVIPISDEAFALIQPPTAKRVFDGLNRVMINKAMHKWLTEKVGITKHITFHCFRHTYATLQIELGTDIYTVQHLLAHRFVSTTQIYVAQASTPMREAAAKIRLIDVKETPSKQITIAADETGISQTTANLLKEMREKNNIKR